MNFYKETMMFRVILTALMFAGFSLQAGVGINETNSLESVKKLDVNACKECSKSHHHRRSGLRNYAVFSNQLAVTTGENITWSQASSENTSDISVDGSGNVTLPIHGVYLVQYTVRVTKSPSAGTSTAVAQLQQTVAGTPTNISQAVVTNNVSFDGVTVDVPESQLQITGSALIHTTSTDNNVINLAITITGGNLAIPDTTGTDANAELIILQLN